MNSTYVGEANKLSDEGAWIWLLEIIGADGTTLRYANNNEDIVWGGHTFTALPFRFDDVQVSTDGKFPEYKVELGEVNLTGAIRSLVQSTEGLPRGLVHLQLVHSQHLTLTTAAVEEYAEILSVDVAADSVVLNVGLPSTLNQRFPRDRYVPSYCRNLFGGAMCRYVQPDHYAISTTATFTKLTAGEYTAGYPVNRISFTGINIISAVFMYALPLGTFQDLAHYALAKDIGFTISGSLYNDGFYLAENYYAVQPLVVYVKQEEESGQAFTDETATPDVRIQLGYNGCDHTLGACKLRNNSQNFGGSPGIAGGVYG